MFLLFCSVWQLRSIFQLCKGRLMTKSLEMPRAFSELKSEMSLPLEFPEAPLSLFLSLWMPSSSLLEPSLGSGMGRTGAEDSNSVGSLKELLCLVVGDLLHSSSTFLLPSLCLPGRSSTSFKHDLFFFAHYVKLDTSLSCTFIFITRVMLSKWGVHQSIGCEIKPPGSEGGSAYQVQCGRNNNITTSLFFMFSFLCVSLVLIFGYG